MTSTESHPQRYFIGSRAQLKTKLDRFIGRVKVGQKQHLQLHQCDSWSLIGRFSLSGAGNSMLPCANWFRSS
jgi:hypothetical protein